jgi:chaperonin GroES
MSVQEGDKVLFGKYSGSDVKIDDAEYKIMRESDLLGKFLD